MEISKNREVDKIVEKILASGRKIALPDECLDIVRLSGIDVPDYIPVKTAEDAAEAAQRMGFPLVLKISSQDILHKSDVGGVVINLNTVQEVVWNYNTVMDNLRKIRPDARIDGVLIQRQLPDTTHLIVGGIYDEQFGPAVMFGLGGVFVDLFKDVSFRIAPVTETEALGMIKEIKAYPVLFGYRGSKKLDLDHVIKTIINISELLTKISIIKEVELNPLFAYERSVQAVDARVIFR